MKKTGLLAVLVFFLQSQNTALAGCPYLKAVYDYETPPGSEPGYLDKIFAFFSSDPNPQIPTAKQISLAEIGHNSAENVFYSRLQGQSAPVVKVQIANQWVYLIQDAAVAKELLFSHENQIGRGKALAPFKEMVGDVFFVHDGPEVLAGRQRFKKTVYREKINFERISEVWSEIVQPTFETPELKFDFYKLVSKYVIGSIGKCFIGVGDLSTIPDDAYLTFLNAAPQIIKAGSDPVSHILGAGWRSDFAKSSHDMQNLGRLMIERNIDSIMKGNNYVWDLALDRGRELGAEDLRTLILTDRWIHEHGPMTAFASINVGRGLFFLLDILSQRPDIYQRIQNELGVVVGQGEFKAEHLQELKYLHAVISEALWQLTPIPLFPREVLESFELKSQLKLRTGDLLMFMFKPIQGPARDFNPDASDRELWAFSKGTRHCPAQPFAFQLIAQFVAHMVLNAQLISPLEPIKYTTRFGGVAPDYKVDTPQLAEISTVK